MHIEDYILDALETDIARLHGESVSGRDRMSVSHLDNRRKVAARRGQETPRGAHFGAPG